MSASAIVLPSQEELDLGSAAFDQDWGAVDDVLYRLCAEHPDHSSRRGLTAKLALIGRAYSTGLERRVTPPKGQQAITVIAGYVYAHRAAVDEILAELRAIEEPVTVENMADIVRLHGLFTGLLLGVTTDGKSPRSFAAKYLHFHQPAVPIYDSYVLAGIRRLVRWEAAEIPFRCPPGGDDVPDGYYQFCVRFWRLLEACRVADLKVSVKSLDTYLWTVPT